MPRGQELRPATTKTPGASFWTNWTSRRQPAMGAGPERWWRRPWGMYPNIKSGACYAPKESIHLQRRRSWCISTDPEFAAKAADIVALYLNPPEHAVILSVDEKPHIQALERAQGYLKLPNGKAVTGFSHEYKRHGTTTLFAALNVLSGQVTGGHAHRRRRRDFLCFMNEVVALYP